MAVSSCISTQPEGVLPEEQINEPPVTLIRAAEIQTFVPENVLIGKF